MSNRRKIDRFEIRGGFCKLVEKFTRGMMQRGSRIARVAVRIGVGTNLSVSGKSESSELGKWRRREESERGRE